MLSPFGIHENSIEPGQKNAGFIFAKEEGAAGEVEFQAQKNPD
jgi:hypothetical protein